MLSRDFSEILRFTAFLSHSYFCSFPLKNLPEGQLCQMYLTLLCQSTWNFRNKSVLDVDLKVVTIKDQSNNIHDICHFEEIKDKLLQEWSNIDTSLVALLEFSQLICFT